MELSERYTFECTCGTRYKKKLEVGRLYEFKCGKCGRTIEVDTRVPKPH